jgi:hypothetical protein
MEVSPIAVVATAVDEFVANVCHLVSLRGILIAPLLWWFRLFLFLWVGHYDSLFDFFDFPYCTPPITSHWGVKLVAIHFTCLVVFTVGTVLTLGH